MNCSPPPGNAAATRRLAQHDVVEVALGPRHTLVDVDVLDLGVLLEPVDPQLAPDAALLVPPEGRQRVDQVPVVDPHRAGAHLLGDLDGTPRVARPHATGEAVDRVVGPLDD